MLLSVNKPLLKSFCLPVCRNVCLSACRYLCRSGCAQKLLNSFANQNLILEKHTILTGDEMNGFKLKLVASKAYWKAIFHIL